LTLDGLQAHASKKTAPAANALRLSRYLNGLACAFESPTGLIDFPSIFATGPVRWRERVAAPLARTHRVFCALRPLKFQLLETCSALDGRFVVCDPVTADAF
jgi:hypothetical protein